MNKMLSTASLKPGDVGEISKKLVSSFKKKLQITAANLNDYEKASKMPPNIDSFAKSIIKDASNYAVNFHELDGESNFPDLYEEFMDKAMSELEKYNDL